MFGMVNLAVSDTPLSRRLIQAGRLEVDFFETSGPLTESAVAALASGPPLLLHNAVWDWSLSHTEALGEKDALAVTRDRLALTGAPFLSVHLGYSAAHVAFEKGSGFVPDSTHLRGMQPGSVPLERDATQATIIRNVRKLQEALDVPLILENLDFNPMGAYDHVCEPSFIAETLQETNAGLLLDLAHAQVSASRLGYTPENYLQHLPLARVRQLHISGPRPDGAALFDAHEPLRDEDYALLGAVLTETDPMVLTLEYGKDEALLLEQAQRLRALLEG